MPVQLPASSMFWVWCLFWFLYALCLFWALRSWRRSRRLVEVLKRHRQEAMELLVEKNGLDPEVQALARKQVGEIMALCKKELGE